MTGDDTAETGASAPARDGPAADAPARGPATDAPARVSNRQLFAVATAFTVAVVALGVAGAAVPRFSRAAGLVVLGCIAAYGAFGLALVYRAGQRL